MTDHFINCLAFLTDAGIVEHYFPLSYTENMPASGKNDRSFNKLSRIDAKQ